MRPIFAAAIIGVGLLVTACATPTQKAAQAAAPAAKPVQTAANSDNPLICGSVEVTGSRMPVHECHTAAEWQRMKTEGTDQFTLDAQRHATGSGGM